jgi:ATP-dependent Lon protease
LGAKREQIPNLIFPLENKRDVDELDPEVKEGVNFKFVSHYKEVINEVFGIDLTQELNFQPIDGR